MIICICSHSPALASPPQVHCRSSGVGFSYGAHHIDLSQTLFTGGFTVLWESNAATDLPGGGAQAVLPTTGNGCKYSPLQRGSFAHPPLPSCSVAQFLTGHGLTQALGTLAVYHSCITYFVTGSL